MPETTPANCPSAANHGNPFRYCACGWVEDQPKRHPSVAHMLGLFEFEHLPPHLAKVSRHFHATAYAMADTLDSGPELTAGLRKLLEAKDCMVRQAVIDARTP